MPNSLRDTSPAASRGVEDWYVYKNPARTPGSILDVFSVAIVDNLDARVEPGLGQIRLRTFSLASLLMSASAACCCCYCSHMNVY